MKFRHEYRNGQSEDVLDMEFTVEEIQNLGPVFAGTLVRRISPSRFAPTTLALPPGYENSFDVPNRQTQSQNQTHFQDFQAHPTVPPTIPQPYPVETSSSNPQFEYPVQETYGDSHPVSYEVSTERAIVPVRRSRKTYAERLEEAAKDPTFWIQTILVILIIWGLSRLPEVRQISNLVWNFINPNETAPKSVLPPSSPSPPRRRGGGGGG
ncbi:hypothetical protein K9N68_37420 (plasmid) [Kovacikia minuta CCNUW1]|uniref:hypothetical protein n=1 Tax=Kovacikia minuta TaxID=2931930 RepID=UPI001CCD305C|nr:hypothetical protein [Kovacikia minuta]UBF29894.1 hypothetical protein K9N68_37420 [Kovacikia minuta CCNUW1]